MKRRFEDLWAEAADDGASCPVGVTLPLSSVDADQLLDAWYQERARRIEAALVLKEAHRLIAGLMTDHAINPRREREARRVMQAIRTLQADDT